MKLKHSKTFLAALAPLIVLVLVNNLPIVTGKQIIGRKLKLPNLRPGNNQQERQLVNKTLVPNVTISHEHSRAQKRSDYDDYDYDSKTLFKSLIPKSPFKKKKPIKKFFRSWFEPEQEALKEESSQSTFYFTSPKTNAFQASQTVLNNGNLRHKSQSQQQHLHHQSKLYRNNVVPPPKHPNFVNRAHYASYTPYYPSYSNTGYSTHYNNNGYRVANIQPQMQPPMQSAMQPQRQPQMQPAIAPPMQSQIQHAPVPAPAPAPQFAIGDPANGRGMTISFDDSDQQPSEPAYTQTNSQYSNQDSGEKSRGINLSFGRGGSGMSLNLGRGSGSGRGVSLSFGGGGGSGMSLNFGGNDENRYKESGSSSYPAYSYSGGSDYGNGYGENNYGYSNNYYYPPKPLFSLVMPSNGKTVVEMNQHPPKLKMKINSSPKVKITTNTKDPLEKPNLEEEVIMEDIFGPPEPFDKPVKNETNNKNNTTSDLNNMTSPFNNTMLPYPYPYYPYPHYYQYPYNYYYNYYQQYPASYYNYMNATMMQPAFPIQQTMTQPPREKKITYTQVASSSMVKPVSSSTQYITPKASVPRSYSQPSSISSSIIPQGQYSSAISTYVQPPRTWTSVLTSKQPIRSQRRQPLSTMAQQSQSLAPGLKVFEASSHKRSSASRNYQKDMLTLSSNSINTIGRQKPIKSMKRKYPKERMVMGESQQQPKYNNIVMAGNFSNPMAYYQYPYYGAGYSFFNSTKNTYNGTYSWSPYNYYYNPYYMNYYNNYYKYAKKYYDSYYGNYTSYYNKKNRTSITGFSQNSFDYEQSKIFGHRMIKYPGGSTKEEKARVIFDIRPRLTIKNLNRTEQMMQDEELKKKKKDHIFKTHMEIIMDTTTAKPYYDQNYYNKYYGYNYGPEVDDFGWTHEPPYATTTTAKPKVISTTTTRRRISTTTEAPSSEASEEEEEENSTTESSTEEIDEDRSSTTTESENDVDSASGEVDEEISAEEPSTTVSTTTTEDTSDGDEDGDGDGEGDEVIEGNEDSQEEPEDATTEETIKEEEEDESTREENDETTETTDEPEEEEEETEREEAAKPANTPAPVTVAPELIQAMIKALQEALGVTTTTPMPSTTEQESNEQIDERVTDDVSNENDIIPTTQKIKTTTSKPASAKGMCGRK